MAELPGLRVLVVEDEYILAAEIAGVLEQEGANVLGPTGSVAGALALIARETPDAALLDVNLRQERVYPVADRLIQLGVPVVFATGYDELLMAPRYIGLPRCLKPIDKAALVRTLARTIAAR